MKNKSTTSKPPKQKTTAAPLKDGPVSIGGQARVQGSDPSFSFDVTADLFVSPAGITQKLYSKGWLFIADYHKNDYPEGSPQRAFIEKNCLHAQQTANNVNFLTYTATGTVKLLNGVYDVGSPTIDAFVKGGVMYGVKTIPTDSSQSEADAVAWINARKDSVGASGSGFSPFG